MTHPRPGKPGIDRLSALPDEILHCVMSFLTSRQAVQTCVLSPRWKDLWRAVPCLNIDHKEFATRDVDEDTARMKFNDFAYALLMEHHVPVLERFRLNVGSASGHRYKDVNRWLWRGIRCRPTVLEITRRG